MSEASKQEIMEATYVALCENGYADLSIQKIADEFSKGKSLIYYHYEDKEELILSFIDYMQKALEASHIEIMELPEDERLDRFLDMTLGLEDERRWNFQSSLLELRAQADHNEKIAEKFSEMDELALEQLEDILESRGLDDLQKAEVILSAIDGTVGRKVATDDREGLSQMKENIKDTIDALEKQ